ncbi:MAG: undecaprenyl-diphosphatase [Solirubrobacteraceae bacterium]|nr:undecaprenyl-diphosphatase [Solirubrobacteraceae bacterium]
MLSYFQAIVLGLVQGIAEPFPISSLGHGVVLPRAVGWNIHQNDKFFLTFLVATHFATALVLLYYFRKDWARIVRGLLRSLAQREIRADDTDAKLGWLLVIGSIPAGVLGLILEHPLRSVFASAATAAAFLILNGFMLLGAEALRRRRAAATAAAEAAADPDARLAHLTWRQSFAIGTSQAIALIPGMSRSGATMGGGLLVGLNNEDAARFSFLLATPIITAAAVLKLPELFGSAGDHIRGQALVGGLCAGLTTIIAVPLLLKFFRTNSLKPFGLYCIALGTVLTIGFAVS